MKRRKADNEACYDAVMCIQLYLLLMGFSQRALDQLKDHQDCVALTDTPISAGFDEGKQTSVFSTFQIDAHFVV